MTQFQHTLRQLLTGEKTETSRICKLQDEAFSILGLWEDEGGEILSVYNHDQERKVWVTGKDYAIQPARGVHSVGRYRVEAIWRQDVRMLTYAQVQAEGFFSLVAFLGVWSQMHDKPVEEFRRQCGLKNFNYDAMDEYMKNRPAERYQAWRMTIKVLWETIDYEAPAVRALQIVKSDIQ